MDLGLTWVSAQAWALFLVVDGGVGGKFYTMILQGGQWVLCGAVIFRFKDGGIYAIEGTLPLAPLSKGGQDNYFGAVLKTDFIL